MYESHSPMLKKPLQADEADFSLTPCNCEWVVRLSNRSFSDAKKQDKALLGPVNVM